MLWSQIVPHYLEALQSRKQLPLRFVDGGISLSLRRLPLDWRPHIAEDPACAGHWL